MTLYEDIKQMTMKELAIVLATIAYKTYETTRVQLAPTLPSMSDKEFTKLVKDYIEVLQGETNDSKSN